MINAGILLGYLAGWAIHAARPDDAGAWRLMLGLGGLPPLILLAVVHGLPESPRWLVARSRAAEARACLQASTRLYIRSPQPSLLPSNKLTSGPPAWPPVIQWLLPV